MKLKLCDEFYYRIESCDLKIEKMFDSCKENIERSNDDISKYEGEWVKISLNKYKTHFVKPAETLSTIAKIYSISEQKIIEDNLLNEKSLFIGQRLKIIKS